MASLKAPRPNQQAAAADRKPACAFTIKSIEDRRDDKGLGALYRTKMDGEGFAGWFAGGMEAMPGYTPSGAPTAVQFEVLKAYIQALGTLKSANLVVRVTAFDASGHQRQATFRGVDGSINWNSSVDEAQAAFNSALADLQEQIVKDLQQHCRS